MNSEAKVVPVVSACIVHGEKVLLSRRLAGRELSTIGKWEFPGGVVHFGENLEDAVKREVWEELKMHVAPRRVLYAQINTYESGINYLVMFFECVPVASIPKDVKDVLEWVSLLSVIYDKWDTLPGASEAARVLLR